MQCNKPQTTRRSHSPPGRGGLSRLERFLPSSDHCFLFLLAALLATISVPVAHREARGDDPLLAGFREPPHEARPSAYWLWLNGYVNRDYVERELTSLRDAGIGGVCVFDMGARGNKAAMPPAGPAFMSKQSVADLAHAEQIARRLGMDMQLSAASSWDMGGDWVEPRHASMGLVTSELAVDGPADFDDVLPFPAVSAKTPRGADGLPTFYEDSAVLAVPATNRRPGHDFVFRLDPRGVHKLQHAVLYNTRSDDPKKYGKLHLFAKDFTIAVSTTEPTDSAFRKVFEGALEPTTEPQRFELSGVEARYIRLRLLSGHNPNFDRIQLAEFEIFDEQNQNLVAAHEANRSRDGADLIGTVSALGQDRNWTAANIHDGSKSGPAGSWSSAGLPSLTISNSDSIIDLTERVERDGRLRWRVPGGRWIIKRFACTNTGETLKVPSPNSNGLATDHFNREATRAYLDELIRRLQSQMGDLSQSALKQLYLASYEVRGAVWTPDMLVQFQRLRGYDMTPYLPALTGDIVVDNETTQRFIYDYRKTLGDLLVDAYYSAAVDAAHSAGLGIESEAGGPGPPIHQVPVDALKAQGAIDEIRGEFWPKRPDAHSLWVVKETACAGHIYGKKRIHMEAFTSMHHWQDGPFDLKPSADRAFCEGMNHVVWHTSSHLPPEAGQPGWVYGAGTHLNANLVWWSKAKPFLDYLSRCSYMLQQGLFVGDVCYYYGDQGYNFVPPKHIDPSLGYGYDYDVTNRDVILDRMTVRDGRIVLPDGMSYALLVMPDRDDIDLQVLRKIEELVEQGATVVGPKPKRSNGLAGYPESDEAVRKLADLLWGECDGKAIRENVVGKGSIRWGSSLRDILQSQGIGPDFGYTSPKSDADIDFIHRRTDEADVYFISNAKPRWEQFEARFRINPNASGRSPEIWNPATGAVTLQCDYRATDGVMSVPLELPPQGSVFIVFRSPRETLPLLRVSGSSNSVGPQKASIEHWDGQQARITVFESDLYRFTTDDGRSAEVVIDVLPESVQLQESWAVSFDAEGIDPEVAKFDELSSWTENPIAGIRHFSGTAKYETTFELGRDWLKKERRVFLDLGDLWAVGEVFVNEQPIGVLWSPPYRVDITEAATAGPNKLVIEVANTWSNRLVGDAVKPAKQRFTVTNVDLNNGLPWKDVPLIKSGLFGPVQLIPAATAIVRPSAEEK